MPCCWSCRPTASRPRSRPLQLFDELAVPIEVEALTAEQTEALMRSVFGDVPYLAHCTARIHELAHGSPRVCMELAQHLVDRGLARYSAGSWSLPSQLNEHDLPADLHASLLARVNRVSEDARELIDALTLAGSDPVPTERYLDLTAHRETRRVFKALDELSAARILIADGERHYFAQRAIQRVLTEVMPVERRAALHSRLADLLAPPAATRSGAAIICSAPIAIARRSSCCAASTWSNGCRRCRCWSPWSSAPSGSACPDACCTSCASRR